MATLSVTVLVLVSLTLHSISALQLGPFTIPTIANGGALGFSSSFLSAALDPQSRRVSFAAQAPPFGNGGSAGSPSLGSLVETFTNPFASFLPSSSSASSSVPIPRVSEFTNTLRSFSNVIPEGVSRIQNAASSFQNRATNALATNASRSVFDPSAILNQFAQLIPTTEQRSAGTRVSNGLNALNPVQSGLNVASNFELNYSSNNDEKNAQRVVESLANSVPEALSKLSSGPTIQLNRKDPHYYPGRHVMVHLFEWTFNDIAVECEQFLGPAGYGGVQVSPVNEYVIAANRPWWERYQPISYKIQSRSGNEQQFATMVRRCQTAGVRVYVDIVVNHMAAAGGSVPLYGTDGSPSDPANRQYPAVPYNRTHFHSSCSIQNYRNATEVRNCELSGLPDLNQAEPYVRDRIVEFMNRLIELGVAGFRMDASKHMQPEDLSAIYKRLNYLNVAFDFPANAAPFIYQEVIDLGNEAVTASQYTDLGEVTEFKYSLFIGLIYYGTIEASAFQALTKNNATQFGLLPSDSALVFVDNHDNQRGHGAGGDSILTFKDGAKYIQAIAFTLATDYGTVRLMSSYNFTDTNQGPPADGQKNIMSPGRPTNDGTCQNGWICEHRWPVVRRLVSFRNLVAPAPLTDVQITSGTFAFCRGSVGFAVFNSGKETVNGVWSVCLPAGEYCDIITGQRVGSDCTGTRVLVTDEGTVSLTLPASSSLILDLIRRVS
ncbi:alpha-amylase A-like [Anopheles maculipalpis]|uniref:alpha-amylase A-like n=1 Tax=Anopheles maculipalpis TaxID=1496333 RepID=UPI002158FA0F|nr:alpha-amylase A-like [Anopheles maculipalpis]